MAAIKFLTRKNKQIVDIAHNYNTHMGYVDKVNAACQLFSYPHKLINFRRELADELQQEGMGLQHRHHYLVLGKRKKCAV